MITPIVATLALLNYQEGQWVPTSVTPAQVAQRVDAALAKLSKTTLKYQYDFDGLIGRAFASCEGTIVAPGVFRIEVPRVNPKNEREAINYEDWISDGKRFGMAMQPKNVVPLPIRQRPGAPADPLGMWPVDFSKVIFSGLGQATHPISKYVAAATKAGFKREMQSRTITLSSGKRTWYRLIVSKGAARYEMVVDASGNLPVAISNTVGKLSTRWSKVDWNMVPGSSLDPKKVNFKKRGATLPLKPVPRRSKA